MTEADDRILAGAQLQALAAPARLEVHVALGRLGAVPADRIARHLGRGVDDVLGHLTRLAEVGIARRRDDDAWERLAFHIDPHRAATEDDRRIGQSVLWQLFDARQRELEALIIDGDERVGAEWVSSGLLAARYLRLNRPQMLELVGEFEAWLDSVSARFPAAGAAPTPDTAVVALHFNLFPVEPPEVPAEDG